MSKYNFCTLFDSNFLIQGIAMYQSLEKNCGDFHLYIFAFDDKSAKILEKIKLSHATIITGDQFENEDLKKIKVNRTKREYYWTCTPSVILYTLEHFNLESCTYLDADLFFFDTPKILLQELTENSILITEHRYSNDNNKANKLGKYCVQFNTFKNDTNGLIALKWWRDRCNEWCYEIPKDGKFGDQKYLDDWKERFEGVHELTHLGGGVAPWNVFQYEFLNRDNKVFGRVTSTKEEFPLVFYHFHKTNIYKLFGKIKTKSYRAINKNKNLQDHIYRPYTKSLNLALAQIRAVDNQFVFNFEKTTIFFWETAKYFLTCLLPRAIR